MPRYQERGKKGRSWPVVLAALAVFGAFGSLQMILAALNVHLVPQAPAAPASSYGVALVQASGNPAPVTLPAAAQPVDPEKAVASMPNVDADKGTALVAAEDTRVRTIKHHSVHLRQPQSIAYHGALPTLFLPRRTAAYTVTDLVQDGALVMMSSHAGLLRENVLVASGAKLSLGAPDLSTLYMASDSKGFTSIVGAGGSLSFTGTAAQPLTIMSWNQATKSAVADNGAGRPYIREIGATMTLAYARVSSLGFWSGRTGGVAWTGTSTAASEGSAVNSTFTGDTYGAFLSRDQGVMFSADRFESNELDGLHIHRYSVGARVISSSAERNGGNGFVVDRATTDTVLRGDVSQHNGANGYLFDGRPLVTGASASGRSNTPSSGMVLEGSLATGDAHTGILIEGGTGIVVKSDHFCSPTTAIALRAGATRSVLTGNYIDCAPRSGIAVGPSAPGTVIFGNIVSRPSIGLLIRNSGPVSMYDNRFIGATVFGVSVRGAASKVGGVGNVMSGTGDRAVDARTGARVSDLSGTVTSGWSHHARVTAVSYLEFHPLASLWLGILVVILLAAGWSFRRKLPDHPYPASVRRTYPLPAHGEPSVAMKAHPARHWAPRPAASRQAAIRPAAGLHPATQPAASRPTGPRPADGRPPGPHPAAYMPQPAPRQQPSLPPGPGRRHAPAAGHPPPGWDYPARDAARRQRPAPGSVPAPLPAPPPAAPYGASASRPEMPVSRGGANGTRATRWQPALPSETNRPSGQERPADPDWEDVRGPRPVPRRVWD